MRHRVRALAISALAISLAAAGCSKTTNSDNKGEGADSNKKAIVVDKEGKTPVPAPEVEGARKGGQLLILQDGDFEHLSPQQIYVGDAINYGTGLFHRTLTAYKEPVKQGDAIEVVGDLATNAGVTTDGGKTWKFTLRDGIKFEDGSPITAKDVVFGLGLSYGKFGVQGPQYLQAAADPKREYQGPTVDKGKPVPGVKAEGDKTVVITLEKPEQAVPYWLTYPISTPVQESKFNNEKYETEFQSSGPYKIKEYKRDSHLILDRNPNWDPKTDPIRHQYPDTVKFDFSVNRQNQTQRVMASTGEDAAAIAVSDVAQENLATVAADPELEKRVIQGATPYANYINMNYDRIKDVDVRRALVFMYDKSAAIKNAGGNKVAVPSTTLMAPVVPGYKKYDAYPMGESGDVAKAKQLMTGKKVEKLTYCFVNTTNGQKAAAIVKASFERDNVFQVALKPIDRKDYYTTIGKKGNDCDLVGSGWGQDWPDGESTLGVLFDGTLIKDEGNNNYSYFNEPSINAELKKLREMTDREAAAKAYGELDEKIMKEFVPVIPTTYTRHYSLIGTKVGGAFLSPLYSQVNVTRIFVKA
ncbi:ABC transporter substrate-binding protein [Longispora albida]|uniref:ABC transporter substrate-binding protein n=1 Tax=Longispora albida TaxID=203523 RepID=UPI00037D97D5|nr:ABC transporter substrate-binding protein [Longispora albida]